MHGWRLERPVLRRRLYARLLLWNRRGLHRLRRALLNRGGSIRPVLRRNWGWPIRLQRLNPLLLLLR